MDESTPKIILGRNLKLLITARGLTLTKLARMTEATVSTLHGYLHGIEPRNLSVLVKLAHFFGITLDELILEKPKWQAPWQSEEQKVPQDQVTLPLTAPDQVDEIGRLPSHVSARPTSVVFTATSWPVVDE